MFCESPMDLSLVPYVIVITITASVSKNKCLVDVERTTQRGAILNESKPFCLAMDVEGGRKPLS